MHLPVGTCSGATESALSVLSLSHALSDGTSSIGDADHKRNNIKIMNKVSSNRRKKKILHEEREQFSAVLEHEAFKSGGLATIREHLHNTIARGKNAVLRSSKSFYFIVKNSFFYHHRLSYCVSRSMINGSTIPASLDTSGSSSLTYF